MTKEYDIIRIGLYLDPFRWQMKYIDKILDSQKTVFTYTDVSLLLGINNNDTIKSFFTRWVKEWVFVNICKWIYTLKKYNIYELSSKIKKNSYISLETVLKKEWVIFQDYGATIFSISNNTISKEITTHNFEYHKIKSDILINPLWIVHQWSYMIASKERAICDRLYLSPDYYFDNLEDLNIDLLDSISQIYSKRVILAVQDIIKNAG